MVCSYEELKIRKNNGEVFNFNEITKEQLEEIFIENIPDFMIAELYDVSKSAVRYKRNKWGIKNNSAKYIYERYKKCNLEEFEYQSKEALNRLNKFENIDWISKAITHYIFRNGPVEDMHSEGKLSQSDMKTLNKFMVDRISGLLKLVHDNDWMKIELLLSFYSNFGKTWDKAEYDISEIDSLWKNMY